MASHEETSSRDIASYIEVMLRELRTLSDREKFDVLTYLIEMALIEATDLAHGIHVKRQEEAEMGEESLAQKWYSA